MLRRSLSYVKRVLSASATEASATCATHASTCATAAAWSCAASGCTTAGRCAIATRRAAHVVVAAHPTIAATHSTTSVPVAAHIVTVSTATSILIDIHVDVGVRIVVDIGAWSDDVRAWRHIVHLTSTRSYAMRRPARCGSSLCRSTCVRSCTRCGCTTARSNSWSGNATTWCHASVWSPGSWCWRSHSSASHRSHRTEEMSAYVSVCDGTRSAIEEVAHAVAVVVVDGEAPAMVGKYDGTIEVAVGNQPVPDGIAQQIAESSVASSHHGHVVIVVVTPGHIVQIVVHAPDVVVVDAINLVDEIRIADAQRVCHAVSQEPCIALYCHNVHRLSVHRHCSGEEDDRGEDSS